MPPSASRLKLVPPLILWILCPPCRPPAVHFPHAGPALQGHCDTIQHALMRCQCPDLVAARLACFSSIGSQILARTPAALLSPPLAARNSPWPRTWPSPHPPIFQTSRPAFSSLFHYSARLVSGLIRLRVSATLASRGPDFNMLNAARLPGMSPLELRLSPGGWVPW